MKIYRFKGKNTTLKHYTLWSMFMAIAAFLFAGLLLLIALPLIAIYKILDSITLWKTEITEDEKKQDWKAKL